jgi:hypothetical protein
VDMPKKTNFFVGITGLTSRSYDTEETEWGPSCDSLLLLFILTALKSPLSTFAKPATDTTGGFIIIVSRNMFTCKENQLDFNTETAFKIFWGKETRSRQPKITFSYRKYSLLFNLIKNSTGVFFIYFCVYCFKTDKFSHVDIVHYYRSWNIMKVGILKILEN